MKQSKVQNRRYYLAWRGKLIAWAIANDFDKFGYGLRRYAALRRHYRENGDV